MSRNIVESVNAKMEDLIERAIFEGTPYFIVSGPDDVAPFVPDGYRFGYQVILKETLGGEGQVFDALVLVDEEGEIVLQRLEDES